MHAWTAVGLAAVVAMLGCVENIEDFGGPANAVRSDGLAVESNTPKPNVAPVGELRAATMLSPFRVAAGADGHIAATDLRAHRVFVFEPDGTLDCSIYVYRPQGVAFDGSGTLFVGDGVGAVRRFGHRGVPMGALGGGSREFGLAADIDYDGDADILFVADSATSAISAYSPAGAKLYSFGTRGFGEGTLQSPNALAVDAEHGLIYVLDAGNQHIDVFERSGAWLKSIASYGTAEHQLSRPHGLDLDSRHRVYVADLGTDWVHVLDTEGRHLDVVGRDANGTGGLGLPTDAVVDHQNRLLVSSNQLGVISVFGIEDPQQSLTADVVVQPSVINAKSSGRWVTAYVEVPGASASRVTVASLRLATLPTAGRAPAELADFDADGVMDLAVKFDRSALVGVLGEPGVYVVDLTGTLDDGTAFEAAVGLTVTRPPVVVASR